MWFFFLYYRQLPASKYRYSKWHELEDMDIKGNMLRSPRVRRSRWLKLIKACLHWFPNFPGETKFVDNAHSVYMLRIHEFLLWIPDNFRIIECHGVPTLPPPPHLSFLPWVNSYRNLENSQDMVLLINPILLDVSTLYPTNRSLKVEYTNKVLSNVLYGLIFL